MEERTHVYPTHKWAWYDFVIEINKQMFRCSECGAKIPKGDKMYLHRRNGQVMKRVCSEQCGQRFDYRMMSAAARQREQGKSRWTR